MDVVDDVDNLELINKIEQGGYLYGIIEFLQKIVGNDGYDKLKAHFVEKEGKLSLTKLGEIYQAIFEQFSPKG
jgi:disulfide oxidoreductase YuzD